MIYALQNRQSRVDERTMAELQLQSIAANGSNQAWKDIAKDSVKPEAKEKRPAIESEDEEELLDVEVNKKIG